MFFLKSIPSHIQVPHEAPGTYPWHHAIHLLPKKKKKRETSVNIRGNTQLSVTLTTVILETQDSYKMTDGPLGDTRKAFRSRNE